MILVMNESKMFNNVTNSFFSKNEFIGTHIPFGKN